MSKIITLNNISTLWNNIKEYIRTYVSTYVGTYVDAELEQEPKLSMLETDGDGTMYLSNNGTYKTITTSGSSGSSSNSNTGTVLYDVDVSNANFYDITISQSAENFTKFDICACTDARELTFTSVYNPNNNNFNIYSMTQESGELIIKTKQYRITEDYISPVNGIGGMSSISSNGVIVNSGDYIGIYKIIGY